MVNIYIGWDSREVKAWHTLAHSIIQHASQPVNLIPLKQDQLRWVGAYWRSKDQLASTEFSLTRFLVPYLSGFDGYSIFMDCDMLCQADITNLITIAKQDPAKAVWVVKHDYTPSTATKMDGCTQTAYPKKNWSSLMVFNNALCQALTPDYVNVVPPSDLHQLKWIPEEQIGELGKTWNWLAGEYELNPTANVIHYTLGGPWFKTYTQTPETDQWMNEWHRISS